MIKEFVDRFMENKGQIAAKLSEQHPDDYAELVKYTIEAIASGKHGSIDPSRIHEIDDGHYQGTLLYLIASTEYQPYDYWYVRVYYGSCSGCDTLAAIRHYSDEKPTGEQVKEYLDLCLHIVQGLKKLPDNEEE